MDSGFAAEGCGGALAGADKGAAKPPGFRGFKRCRGFRGKVGAVRRWRIGTSNFGPIPTASRSPFLRKGPAHRGIFLLLQNLCRMMTGREERNACREAAYKLITRRVIHNPLNPLNPLNLLNLLNLPADRYLLQMSHYRHVPRFFASLRMTVPGGKRIADSR